MLCYRETRILEEPQHCLAAGFMLVCIQVIRRQGENWYADALNFWHSRYIFRLQGCLQTCLSPSMKHFDRSLVSSVHIQAFFWRFGGWFLSQKFCHTDRSSMLHLDLFLRNGILTKRSLPLFLRWQNINNLTAEKINLQTHAHGYALCKIFPFLIADIWCSSNICKQICYHWQLWKAFFQKAKLMFIYHFF